MSVEISTRPAD